MNADTAEGTYRSMVQLLGMPDQERQRMIENGVRCFRSRYEMKRTAKALNDLFEIEFAEQAWGTRPSQISALFVNLAPSKYRPPNPFRRESGCLGLGHSMWIVESFQRIVRSCLGA